MLAGSMHGEHAEFAWLGWRGVCALCVRMSAAGTWAVMVVSAEESLSARALGVGGMFFISMTSPSSRTYRKRPYCPIGTMSSPMVYA